MLGNLLQDMHDSGVPFLVLARPEFLECVSPDVHKESEVLRRACPAAKIAGSPEHLVIARSNLPPVLPHQDKQVR